MTKPLTDPGTQDPAAEPAADLGVDPVWPGPTRDATPRLLASAGAAGLVVAALPPSRPGLNVLLAGMVVISMLIPVAQRSRTSACFGTAAVVLLTVPLVRDAGWLVVPAIILAVLLASYALVGGRGWTELIGGGMALALAVPRVPPWATRGVKALARSRERRPVRPLVRSLLLAAGLLVLFGVLFAQADAAFRSAVVGLVPDVSPGLLLVRLLSLAIIAGAVLTGAYLASAPPRFQELAPPPAPPAGRTAWAIPIAALDLLFLGFAAVQAEVLRSADKGALLKASGLSYAEYARQGFWQLLIVTGLVLVVVAVAVRYAPRDGRRDRALVRVLLGLLCALTLVVVAVALRRLFLYEEAYGYTRLRVWVHAFELWMGLVIVLIAVAGIRLRAGLLPRAVALTGAGGLLALCLLDPDGLIAARTVRAVADGGKADPSYLAGLSADAVPALDRLPEPMRSCVLRSQAVRLQRAEPWAGANLARHRARTLLARRPVDARAGCADVFR